MTEPVLPAGAPAAGAASTQGSGRWLSLLASRSGVLLGAGLILLLIAVGSTFYFLHQGKEDQRCVVAAADRAFPPPADPQKPRILRVEPVEFQFDKAVCVIVDTAISPVTLEKLRREFDAAEAAAAQAAPAAAAAVTRAQANAAPAPQGAQGPPAPQPGTPEPPAGPSVGATQAASAAAGAAQARLQAAQRALQDFTKGAVYKLYINGQPSSLKAHIEGRADPQPLTFTVQPEDDASSANASYWRDILAGSQGGKVPIKIGLGQEDAAAPIVVAPVGDRSSGATAQISFVLYKPIVMYTALFGLLFILLGVAGLAHGTALLREGAETDSAFSLSRVQMAFWLVLSTTGFLYVWLVTGEYKNVFPAALFVLIGISGATAGAAQFLGGPSIDAPKSKTFLRDIAGDWVGGQMQLHRMQIIAWTVILGLIFCWNIAVKLQLTSFDTNLLILAGVANGVYVTLKTTETK